jgi:hypothetical protein
MYKLHAVARVKSFRRVLKSEIPEALALGNCYIFSIYDVLTLTLYVRVSVLGYIDR